jgi:hypothetical protein
MPRLSFLMTAIALVATLGLAPTALAAQEATPVAHSALFPDTLGLPELTITATGTAFEGVPAATAEGRYIVTFTNNATDPAGAAVHFMQLPEGVTLESLTAPPIGDIAGTANWFYEVYQAGGTIALPGQTAQVILDLVPGEYIVWGGFPSLPQAPVAMTVTVDSDALPASARPEPNADLTVTEVQLDDGDFAFELEGDLAPGLNVIKIVNNSDQPHYFFIERYPEPVTLDQVQAALFFDTNMGTPPPGMIDQTLLELTISASTQSAGTTQWLAVNLQPGSHVISCFVEDPAMGGLPHAYEGMIDVIQIGDAATPAP